MPLTVNMCDCKLPYLSYLGNIPLCSGVATTLSWPFFWSKGHTIYTTTSDSLSDRFALMRHASSHPLRRVFVMGCGRSGTWLLTSVFTTFADTCVLADEVDVSCFGVLLTENATLIIKRSSDSYLKISSIAREIDIVYVIRHPFDVLTSYNPVTRRSYHINPNRWLGEMNALQDLLSTRRCNLIIVKYEDLVANPFNIQKTLSSEFELAIECPPVECAKALHVCPAAVEAMHGIRPIDTSSIGRFRHSNDNQSYLKQITPRLDSVISWVADRFEYDIDV
jgi:hypothetical protein